jgi:hypothetical protein
MGKERHNINPLKTNNNELKTPIIKSSWVNKILKFQKKPDSTNHNLKN